MTEGKQNEVVRKCAEKVFCAIEHRFESDERLRLGKWLNPTERQEKIIECIAATITAALTELTGAAVKECGKWLNPPGTGTVIGYNSRCNLAFGHKPPCQYMEDSGQASALESPGVVPAS